MSKPQNKKRRAKFTQNQKLTYEFASFLIELLDSIEVDYDIEEETNKFGNPIIHINCEQMYGFFTIGARKGFMGVILNNGEINWMKQEGFSEDQLEGAPIWINFKDEEGFFKLLIPREYQSVG